MSAFNWPVTVRWADLDPNGHVRHSVYYDYGAQARITCLQKLGVGIGWLAQQGLGPVLFREEAKFYRELVFGDDLLIDTRLSGLATDHRKWSMRHRILRGDELCALLDLDGAWLDLQTRRIVVPPQTLIDKFESLERTEDFQVIGSVKGEITADAAQAIGSVTMPEIETPLDKGKKMLEEVALQYAHGHGLRPEVEWQDHGYEWTLKATDERHTVRVAFSPDEIEMFVEDLPENRETKMKIRNAFASLSM